MLLEVEFRPSEVQVILEVSVFSLLTLALCVVLCSIRGLIIDVYKFQSGSNHEKRYASAAPVDRESFTGANPNLANPKGKRQHHSGVEMASY